MTNHEYLMQIRLLNRKIKNKLQELEQIRTMTESISAIRYDKDKIQTSPSPDRITNDVVKIIETEQELDSMIDEFVDKKNEIISVIDKLEDPMEYDIIHKYYVQEMLWKDVADAVGYSEKQVRRIKNRALQKVVR